MNQHLPELAMAVAFAAISIWFWFHCARPALLALHAPRLTLQIVMALTIAAVVVQGFLVVAILSEALPALARFVWNVISFTYLVVVMLSWPRYRFLIRLTRRPRVDL